MQPEARERLRHVLDAGDTILAATTGKSFGDYAKDRILKHAIERLFTIVGEALREASRVQPDIAGVWRIIEQNLPTLLTEVRALLATPDEPA